jgi:acetyltransferase-like isoleucine patch superfamily enzyme
MAEIHNSLKIFVKRMSCIIKGIGSFAEDAYVSPSAEVKYAGRVTLGKGAVLEPHARLCANGEGASISIGPETTIYPYALLKANGGKIEINGPVAIHDYCVLYGNGGIVIEGDVHIAAHTAIVASEHDYTRLGTDDFSQEVKGRGIKIEKSVWIGANAVILDGVTIGTGSVIGAGAVVTRDIPPHSIAVGVPARVIKKR